MILSVSATPSHCAMNLPPISGTPLNASQPSISQQSLIVPAAPTSYLHHRRNKQQIASAAWLFAAMLYKQGFLVHGRGHCAPLPPLFSLTSNTFLEVSWRRPGGRACLASAALRRSRDEDFSESISPLEHRSSSQATMRFVQAKSHSLCHCCHSISAMNTLYCLHISCRTIVCFCYFTVKRVWQ